MRGIIGRTTTIVKSTNRDLVGLKGKIIDETQNMVMVMDSDRTRMIEKKTCVFQISGEKVPGKEIMGRAKDRMKKKKKKVKKRW